MGRYSTRADQEAQYAATAAPKLSRINMCETYNFSANGTNFGDYTAETQSGAQEAFAQDAGYKTWAAMFEQAEENGGNTVEIREVLAGGARVSAIPAV